MTGEDIVNKIVGLSKSNQGLKEFLDKHAEKELPVDKATALNGLQKLDPVKHSLLALFLIDAIGNDGAADLEFIQHTSQLIQVCSTDIRKSPKRFVRICRRLQAQLQSADHAKMAILPLIQAISKLDDTPNVITPIHPILFHACLVSEDYSAALPFMYPTVCNIDPRINKLTIKDFLLFAHYGALIFIGRRQYAEALDVLLHAITAPAMQMSAITAAAYKKYVLISLIHKGRLDELPRFTSGAVTRGIRMHCSEYTSFAEDYNGDLGRYSLQDNKLRQKVVTDGNLNLLDLAVESQTKRNILQLTETYMTMPIQQISASAGISPDKVEMMLLRMIEEHEITAKIDDLSGLVSFEEDLSDAQISKMAQKIESQLQEAVQLAEKVKIMTHEVSCDKAFISKTENSPPAGLSIAT